MYREAHYLVTENFPVLWILVLSLALPLSFYIVRQMKEPIIPRHIRFLLSHVWPSDDPQLQLWMIAAIAMILIERSSLALGNQKLGILVDRLLRQEGQGTMYRHLGSWMGFHIIGSFTYVTYLGKNRLLHFWESKFRNMVFSHLMDLSADYHDQQSAVQKEILLDRASTAAKLNAKIIFQALPTVVDILVSTVYLQRAVGGLATVALLLWGAMHFHFCNISEFWNRSHAAKSRRAKESEEEFCSDRIRNWNTVSLFNGLMREKRAYGDKRTQYCNADQQYSDRCFALFEMQSFLLTLSKVGALLLLIKRISTGSASAGEVITLVSHWELVLGPINNLATDISILGTSRSSIEIIIDFLQTNPTILNQGREALRMGPCHIEIKGVTFAYNNRQPLFEDLNITIPGGKTTALVGETGSGKSTILNLLFRYYDVLKGSITIDGTNIREIDVNSLRENISTVPQNPRLLQGTLDENFRYGQAGATEEDIIRTCEAVSIHKTIMQLPEKYSTKVWDGDERFSGGENQRMAIARALLRKCGIYLVDEATSAVDSNTESRIKQALLNACAGKTTIIVAHRLSTIMDADQIVVLGDGAVQETGTHLGLMKRKGRYYRLWQQQTGNSE